MHYTTYKRWTLNDGSEESDLVDLVRGRVIPHYRTLDAAVRLELARVDGTRSYLAVQHWPSRHHRETVLGSERFERWYEHYLPILLAWGRLVTFESEWEVETLVD